MPKQLFTVGHSSLSIEDFIGLLVQYKVDAIADVRSHPYSRYLPHFNRDLLKFELLKAKIKYVFLGDELGARPKDLSCYINGKVLYAKIADSDGFKVGIERILTGLNKYSIALMCSEKDPLTCHRTILICKHLQLTTIKHIIDRHTLETHSQLEDRLLDLYGFDPQKGRLKKPEILQFDLFTSTQSIVKPNSVSQEEFLEQAYIKQEDKIAYRDR